MSIAMDRDVTRRNVFPRTIKRLINSTLKLAHIQIKSLFYWSFSFLNGSLSLSPAVPRQLMFTTRPGSENAKLPSIQ